jgi:hypothetical protein
LLGSHTAWLCKEAVEFLNMAAEGGVGSETHRAGKGAWLVSLFREVNCALKRGNRLIYAYAKSTERLIRAQERHFMPGPAMPPPLGEALCKLSCEFVLLSCSFWHQPYRWRVNSLFWAPLEVTS